MSNLPTKIKSDIWMPATWEEYIQIIENTVYEKARCYYYDGHLRIEMTPIGNDHSLDHTIIIFAVNLYATLKGIPLNGRDNCTYRQTGFQECQPDISYYISENSQVIPWGTSVINLDDYPSPELVIEVANTSLADDQGQKRLLYEDLQVKEYWIVDVQNVRMLAFAIENGGSRRISESLVLPGLGMPVLEEALRQSRTINQSQVGAWLLQQFQ
ncbi:MAG: Uma2 family endonuclease [Microcoleus vaginatus WJT46-NPBG5]|jgi:Uma2 family endonuclease|nr:Uma2 family endonuclease [Microcoleus vaginatus WJT46-NPBG5]